MSVIGINEPRSRTISLIDVEEKYGLLVGYFFTINSIIGAGILGVPWAFQAAGWLLALITFLFFAALSLVLA